MTSPVPAFKGNASPAREAAAVADYLSSFQRQCSTGAARKAAAIARPRFNFIQVALNNFLGP